MKIEFKQLLLYAILPALVAGLFSIAPKVYEVLFETNAILHYALSTGPSITSDGAVQQVVSVRVSNAGKKPLTSITAELSVLGATLLAASVENSSGLAIEQKKTDTKVLVQLPQSTSWREFLDLRSRQVKFAWHRTNLCCSKRRSSRQAGRACESEDRPSANPARRAERSPVCAGNGSLRS